MKKMSKMLAMMLVGSSVLLTACTNTDYRPEVYQQSDLQKAHRTEYATIKTVKEIVIKQDEGVTNPLLTVAGTVAGGIAGSHIGGGKGQILSAIGGGLLGGYATNEAVKATQTQKGVEFTLIKDDGQMITFAQQGDARQFSVGQRVKLVTHDGKTKVTH